MPTTINTGSPVHGKQTTPKPVRMAPQLSSGNQAIHIGRRSNVCIDTALT
jgi:hypothetical protein